MSNPSDHPLRAVIVGAGPAGFYTADQLLSSGFEVDLVDQLPTPFGLVRSGVAPDHPNIKAVTRIYEKTASRPGFRFFGNVSLGGDVTREELLARYHAVVYAFGTTEDNRMGIPGEDRPGSVAASRFVAWYNGHPHAADELFDLSPERAVVVGNGNVALDVARMLVLEPDNLGCTDAADHAIDAFGEAGVREVVILGRRGPAQAAFTHPELRELGELERTDVIVDPRDLELDEHSERWLAEEGEPTNRRNVELLRTYSERPPAGRSHRLILKFFSSPLELIGHSDDARVTGLRVGQNRLETDGSGRLRAVATGEEQIIECGLVVRSIGYCGRLIDVVPFDLDKGRIRNTGGRVCDDSGRQQPGEYAVGWIKRGPSGVIGTNKKDAADTCARIREDVESGSLNVPACTHAGEVEPWLAERAPEAVRWEGWRAIDSAERAAGEPCGRPRVKIVRLAGLLEASASTITLTELRQANTVRL